jgi:hypothetical protein
MTRSRINADQARTESLNVVPHIIPDVLHPAIAGKLLDGSTAHGSTYGVAQADGRMYYYTDIKGSKPIKDPRIGSHFGSQRHKFKSLQLLEQETATHGENVYSVDGREWCRMVGSPYMLNHNEGHHVYASATVVTIEITGYFNDLNFLSDTHTQRMDDIDITVNGGTTREGNATIGGRASVPSPLSGRYVDTASVVNIGSTVSTDLGTSPTINTIKLVSTNVGSEYWAMYGIELIAQDTTSTANKSKIQIPSQNVVSYGKKFTVGGSSAHTHYDPFNGFTNGTTLHSAVVDTATSLGLSTGTLHGATWAISGSNNIRPYNGGRVVKWVDSSGVIKTSVNMMPPNAQNISTTAAAEITTPSATNTAYLPAFSDDAVDSSLAEVAKTFNYREFGNGSANGGTGATYADASMLTSTNDNIAYVMDDGLTSLSANAVRSFDNASNGGGEFFYNQSAGTSEIFFTFIGTGLSFDTPYSGESPVGWSTIAQNLPYGTHVYKISRPASGTASVWLDGVQIYNGSSAVPNLWRIQQVTFHQPKMPPIPEDAVVIADYMLMADFVPQTTSGPEQISKGVRKVSCSRDVFYTKTDGDNFALALATIPEAFTCTLGGTADNATSAKSRISVFGTNYVHRGYQSAARSVMYIADTVQADAVLTKGAATPDVQGSYQHLTSSLTVGSYTWGINAKTGQNGTTGGFDIASPIHTSSHYQSFETPFLHELVGGDRNMEQTNLVVTPNGKTWDEVTRDVGYIGPACLQTVTDNLTNWTTIVVLDEWRGTTSLHGINFLNKDFAIAYDRVICLVGGLYSLHVQLRTNNAHDFNILVNGATAVESYSNGTNEAVTLSNDVYLKRGDYVQLKGEYGTGGHHDNHFKITRLK